MSKTNQSFRTTITDHKTQRIEDKEKKRMLTVVNLMCVFPLLVLVLALTSMTFSMQSFVAKERIVTVAKERIISAAKERIIAVATERIGGRIPS